MECVPVKVMCADRVRPAERGKVLLKPGYMDGWMSEEEGRHKEGKFGNAQEGISGSFYILYKGSSG